MFNRDDFAYPLPDGLIAQHPPTERGASRLLAVLESQLAHLVFAQLPDLLRAGDLLVVNDTRVINGRLQAEKDTGGRAEILLERIETERLALCQVRSSKALKPGRTLRVGDAELVVHGRQGHFYRLEFAPSVLSVLDQHGTVPLPPYIERPPTPEDEVRYQTVWNQTPGAIAAPTAGLHFTDSLLERIRADGVRVASITLHVGAGTFQPLRSRELGAHRMHQERFNISPAAVAAIDETHQQGGRIVAVGTTVVRALESAACGAYQVRSGEAETALFITPGYRFQVVDALLTNFHLPESTLLMLVCAFAGYQRVMDAYRAAVANEYRFFSYGDAMFLEREFLEKEEDAS